MITTIYHGSSNFDPRPGYTGAKKDSTQYGIGLYCTNSYNWAELYGRYVYALTVELNEKQHANNVEITIENLQYWVNCYCSQKVAKIFKKEFSQRKTMTAHRFELWLYWNVRRLHLIAKELAAFFTAHGITHNSDHGNYGGKLVRIYDFDIIKGYTKDKEVLQKLNYNNTELPDYLKEKV
ncbi:hypothetical protein BZF66_05930 [Salmonella enterica]|uniref:hypothetical protein n=1 Tax=Salmonella enterica TaxID=28901 RepID=UPI00127102AD|nr:hypothetical protein [Salmonella enterica]ECV9083965.1 hypothetical protein [Salmonella enterica subsp. enterica serovar Infantis]MCP0435937.1 hypothetical protein [Salmonella enterica subsp. enterica serovar Mbandaka]EAZ2022832.1 hypothetical protein [Salmonella enterica]ECC6867695.1 hypothetical protein [Salmonella enterica]